MDSLASDVTAFLVKVCVAGTLYLTYQLVAPYGSSILTAVFLSIVMHPTHRLIARTEEAECAAYLAEVSTQWSTSRGSWRYWAGVFVSMFYFAEWGLWRASFAMGVHKFPVVGKQPLWRNAVLVTIFSALGISVSSAQVVAVVLCALFAVNLVLLFLTPLSYTKYVFVMKRLCEWTIGLSLLIAIGIRFFWDVAELSSAVTSGGKSGIEQLQGGLSWLATRMIPQDLLDIALKVKDEFGPVLGELEIMDSGSWLEQGQRVMSRGTQVFGGNFTELREAASKYVLTAGNSMVGILTAGTRTLLSTMVDVVGLVYEAFLFMSIYYTLKARDRSALYYVLEKLAQINHPTADPKLVESIAEQRENSIVEPLRALLMSYWHVAWWYFWGTFILFTITGMSYATLASVASLFIALFPFVSPLLPAFIIPVGGLVVKGQWFQLAFLLGGLYIVSVGDAYLVRVSGHTEQVRSVRGRKLRKASPAIGKKVIQQARKSGKTGDSGEWYDFIVKTSAILGLMSFGMLGIIIGPSVAIVVRQMWLWVGTVSQFAPSSSHASPSGNGEAAGNRGSRSSTTAQMSRPLPTNTAATPASQIRHRHQQPTPGTQPPSSRSVRSTTPGPAPSFTDVADHGFCALRRSLTDYGTSFTKED